ncbi:hypothetical protein [Streptomyces sp. M92]|nr:hypothetical protein [Streptomyces sp. M92]WCN02959.1 hypothetical protein M6G08_13155 [Streptomyces sp. M92]
MARDLPVLIDESVQAVHTSTGEGQRLAYECLAETFRCVFTVVHAVAIASEADDFGRAIELADKVRIPRGSWIACRHAAGPPTAPSSPSTTSLPGT